MALNCSHSNLVNRNEILRHQVSLEERARSEWQKKWGFLLDFNKFCINEAVKRAITKEQYENLIGKLRRQRKFVGQCNNNNVGGVDDDDDEKRIPFVPNTSSGFIGWRRNDRLENVGPLYVSPKHTVPYEPPVRTIILG